MRSVATKCAVYPKLRFGVEVDRASSDEDRHCWRVHLSTGEWLVCRYLVGATGGLITPKMPKIPGIEGFAGTLIHTARWDDGCDLTGKRVAVIGTGATAVQLVPAIAPRVAHLDVYQRTPIWLLKKPDAEIPQWVKTTFRLLPPVQRALRLFTDVSTETVMVGAALYYRQIPGLVRWAERACKQNLLEQVPNDPELRARLTPTYSTTSAASGRRFPTTISAASRATTSAWSLTRSRASSPRACAPGTGSGFSAAPRTPPRPLRLPSPPPERRPFPAARR